MGTPCAQLFFDCPGCEHIPQPIENPEPKQCAEHHAKPGTNTHATQKKKIFKHHLFGSPFGHAILTNAADDFGHNFFALFALNPPAIRTGWVLG
jgi:hypothetical protein